MNPSEGYEKDLNSQSSEVQKCLSRNFVITQVQPAEVHQILASRKDRTLIQDKLEPEGLTEKDPSSFDLHSKRAQGEQSIQGFETSIEKKIKVEKLG